MTLDTPNRMTRLYLLSLAIFGLLMSVRLGLAAQDLLTAAGFLDDPAANLPAIVQIVLVCLIPMWLTMPSWLPRGVRHPHRVYHMPLVILIAAAVFFLSSFAFLFLAARTGLDVVQARALLERVEAIDLAVAVAGVVALLTCIVAAAMGGRPDRPRRARAGAARAARPAGPADPFDPRRPTRAQRRAIAAAAPPDSRALRAFIALDWLVRLAAGGAAVATFGAVAHLSRTDPTLAGTGLPSGPAMLAVYAIAALIGVALALPFRLPGDILIRPRTLLQALVGRACVAAPLVLATGWIAPQVIALGYFTEAAPFADLAMIAAKALAGTVVVFGILIARAALPQDELIYRAGLGPRADDPSRALDPGRARRPVPLPQPKLPAIGAMMKLYIAADWLVMRLMGVALLGTAWMLWTMIDDGRASQAALLAHGFDPLRAVIAYCIAGTFLSLPVLLPGFISAPRHVFGGLLKAVILVGCALVLVSPLNAAIVAYIPQPYHTALLATVPPLLRAITGVAITSTLLIAFFRQLGTLPKLNYRGEPIMMMSDDELRGLRQARMGTEAVL